MQHLDLHGQVLNHTRGSILCGLAFLTGASGADLGCFTQSADAPTSELSPGRGLRKAPVFDYPAITPPAWAAMPRWQTAMMARELDGKR